MLASNSLETFFKENIYNQAGFFLLYKDKQLLKQQKYEEFAKEQIKKTRNVFLSISFALIYGMYYGVTSLIEYGESKELLMLIFGLLILCFMASMIFASTKEYYSVKSSMSLFLKLLEEEKSARENLSTELKN